MKTKHTTIFLGILFLIGTGVTSAQDLWSLLWKTNLLSANEVAVFSPDGTKIATGEDTNKVVMWNAANGAPLWSTNNVIGPVLSIAFSPDGTKIVTGGGGGTSNVFEVKLWDASTGNLIWSGNHTNAIRSVKFSPDGTKIVSASDDKSIKVWNTSNGVVLLTGIHTDAVKFASFDSTGTKIVSGGADKKIKVWNVSDGSLLWESTTSSNVLCADFNPAGSKIVSGESSNKLKMWNSSNGSLLWTGTVNGSVVSAKFSPDGNKIVTAQTTENTVKVWNASDGSLLWTGANTNGVTTVNYSPDGKKIVSGSSDGAVKVWNADSGNLLWTGMHSGEVRSAEFSSDNKKIVSGSKDKSIKVWNYERTILLTSPVGGETFRAGSTQNITWNSQNVSNVKIEYSTNNGTNWLVITNSIAANADSISWLIPNVNSNQCKVRITDVDSTSLQAVSLNIFTITYLPVITVTSPVGGESWLARTSHNITWTSDYVQKVKIQYTTNSGATWFTIIDSIAAGAGTYEWSIPNTPSSNCKVMITDINNSAVKGTSPYSFSIFPAVVTVTNPKGGESWKAGSQQNINWTSVSVSNVKIEFSPDDGDAWSTVIKSTPADDEFYLWIVPNISSTKCRIRISDASDPSVSDICQAPFTIYRPSITLTGPNGGEVWAVDEYKPITWASVYVTNVKLQYSTNAGTNWQTIIGSISADINKYIWQVPNTISEQCKIKIIDADNTTIFDESDTLFSISPAVGVEEGASLPTTYRLDQNYPNPFNPATSIKYQLPEPGSVKIKIYNVLGNEVATLVNEYKSAGYYNAKFDASKLTSGIYIYTITVNNFVNSRKMILLK